MVGLGDVEVVVRKLVAESRPVRDTSQYQNCEKADDARFHAAPGADKGIEYLAADLLEIDRYRLGFRTE